MHVDTSKVTGTQKTITIKGIWFYGRHFIIIGFVAYIMFTNLHNSECNLIAMIFFAVIGISSLIEIGFRVDNVIQNISKFKDKI